MSSQKENTRICCMCGSSPSKDPGITLHRFPKPGSKNALRCELWVKYCFPDEAWSSPKFQDELHNKHKMLCSKHFKSTCFNDRKLFRTAVPDVQCHKDTTICNLPETPAVFEPVAGPSRMYPLREDNANITTPTNSGLFVCESSKQEGPLHHFPKPESDIERFVIWKAVLDNYTKEKGNMYIFNQLRLCNQHFEKYFLSASRRLTRNAIPTIYIKKGGDQITLHSFPNPDKVPDRFRSWIYAVKGDILALDNKVIYEKRRICHNHFESKYRTWTKSLTPNAIPTLHLPDGIQMHSFPNPHKDPARYQDWVKNIGGEVATISCDYVFHNRRICHRHFDESFITMTNRLFRTAVPTLFLPGHPPRKPNEHQPDASAPETSCADGGVTDESCDGLDITDLQSETPIVTESAEDTLTNNYEDEDVRQPLANVTDKSCQVFGKVGNSQRLNVKDKSSLKKSVEAKPTTSIDVKNNERSGKSDILTPIIVTPSTFIGVIKRKDGEKNVRQPLSNVIDKSCQNGKSDKSESIALTDKKPLQKLIIVKPSTSKGVLEKKAEEVISQPFANLTDRSCQIVGKGVEFERLTVTDKRAVQKLLTVKSSKDPMESQEIISSSTKETNTSVQSNDDIQTYVEHDTSADESSIEFMENTSEGLCRCCGTMKKCRVLNIEYESLGQKEIYSDMIMDCYGLLMSHLDGVPSDRLICATCVTRIRDALNFRRQVLQCEEAFLKMKEYDIAVTTNTTESKLANKPIICQYTDTGIVKVEPMYVDNQSDVGDALADASDCDQKPELSQDSNSNDDLPLKSKMSDMSKSAKSVSVWKKKDAASLARQILVTRKRLAERLRQKAKWQATRQQYIMSGNKTPRESPLKNEVLMSKLQQQMREKDPSYKRESNIMTIVEYSYVCPFKCRHNHLLCYYCGEIFSDPVLLREHTLSRHNPRRFKITEHRNIIKIDLTRIDCRLCGEKIDSLDDFRSHITSVHNKKYYYEYKDSVLPFKLSRDNLKCALCENVYPYFHALNKHMNEHFRNYMCETCGLGFVDSARLAMHQQRHEEGEFPCNTCGKVFKAQFNRDLHVDRVHRKMGRVYCPKCDVKLMSYPQKLKHLVEVHGEEPLSFRCDTCDKMFDSRRMLTLHKRKEHLKDYRYVCQCGQKFFTRFALNNHMPVHTGERNFKCKVCEKTYPRLKTLKDHMRIHNNDRRYRCHVCGQAFIQNCSLKGHMKSQHPEYG